MPDEKTAPCPDCDATGEVPITAGGKTMGHTECERCRGLGRICAKCGGGLESRDGIEMWCADCLEDE